MIWNEQRHKSVNWKRSPSKLVGWNSPTNYENRHDLHTMKSLGERTTNPGHYRCWLVLFDR
ncbi:hypothetical protein GALL_495760 [mine drainage metagenome]|uniref:Uncharacterized protein n=1 Tax=mine drainage metagenome TaxID=410659 RepID=A0A1J5PU65_9ZZZZ